MTLHEALAMTGPLSTCGAVPTALAGLNALVGSESENFYPILAGFGAGVTQVEAAVALHPQYATVLLGENDLLKPAFSNNGAPVTAPSSFRDDTAAIVAQLRAAGANVLLANLPDPLKAATFIPQPFYTATLAAVLTTSIAQQNPTLPLSNARALAAQTAQFYASAEIAQSGLGAGGYFTINALFATLAAAAQQGPPPTLSPVGDFVSDALAAQTESLLAAYNAAIASVATTKGVALVDLNALNTQASYGAAIQVAPGDFVTATYGSPRKPKVCSPHTTPQSPRSQRPRALRSSISTRSIRRCRTVRLSKSLRAISSRRRMAAASIVSTDSIRAIRAMPSSQTHLSLR